MSLFPTGSKTNDAPMKYTGDRYTYFCESSRDTVKFAKRMIESWFRHYPLKERKELRRRIKSQFDPVFYEMFLHELLLKLNCRVKMHTSINGEKKRPDFYVEEKNKNNRFVLEAKICNDTSEEEKRQELYISTIKDYINENFKVPRVLLFIKECKILSQQQPSAKFICAFLEDYIKNNPNCKSIKYEDDKIFLLFTVHYLPKNRSGRAIGGGPITTKWGGSTNAIRKALSHKATKYGNLEMPYIIALNYLSSFGTDEFDELNALFGDQKEHYSINGEYLGSSRESNGFLSPQKNTRVSAILISSIFPGSLAKNDSIRARLYLNPWAQYPYEGVLSQLDTYRVDNKGQIQHTEGKNILDILGIDNSAYRNKGASFTSPKTPPA